MKIATEKFIDELIELGIVGTIKEGKEGVCNAPLFAVKNQNSLDNGKLLCIRKRNRMITLEKI